jgi:hypothetical protein
MPGSYVLIATNLNNGCTATDSVQVALDNIPPKLTVKTDTITCAKPQSTISVQSSLPGSQFTWIGPDINPSNVNLAVFQVGAPGQYNVTVTGPNGCSSVAVVNVAASVDFPEGSAEGALLDCKNNGAAMLDGHVITPGATFSWLNPAGQPFSTILTPTVTQAGTYTFVITASNGCQRSIQVSVLADFNKPQVQIQPTELLDCNTTAVTIHANGTAIGSAYSYHWTTANGNILSGADGLSPVVNKAGDYQLLVVDNLNGCMDSATVQVKNDPAVPTGLDLALRNITCYGDHNGSIAILNVHGGTKPFVFSLNGGDHTMSTLFSGLAADSYVVALEDANGCRVDTTVVIYEPGPLLLELGPDKHIQLGDSVTILAQIDYTTPLASVIWNYAPNCDSAQGKACLDFTYTPLQTTRHTVTVIDSNGCKVSDAITVLVSKKRPVFVPNIFNPGSDDPLNAILMIQGGAGIRSVHRWLVFDRWGNAVFETRDFLPNTPAHAWDGNVRGEKAPPAVYTWFAEIEFIDGEIEIFKGDVTLLR